MHNIPKINHQKNTKCIVQTVYFGGGTPSLFSAKFFEKIINEIAKRFSFVVSPEITIEINPNTISIEKLSELKSAGLTRPSFGIQSFDENILKFLGRSHSKQKALAILNQSKKLFKTFSADFIYGLPNQKSQDWRSNLDFILSQNIPHLSLYSLSLEKGTPFAQRFSTKDLDDGEFYEITRDACEKTGYLNYEISNFAKTTDDFSKHNLAYWKGESYLGLGPSAHGRVEISPQNWIATEGISNLKKWKEKGIEKNNLTKKERAEEIIMMFLRTSFELKESFLIKKTGQNFGDILDFNELQKAVKNNWIIYKNNSIKTTKQGRQFLNSLLKNIIRF